MAIKESTLDLAIVEAMRFIKAAKKLRDNGRSHTNYLTKEPIGFAGGALAASCKRASLDLTKTLADLRKGR